MSTALSIKPEDKTKVIALGAAVTLMFGYVGVNFARSMMHSSSPPAPTPTATPAAATPSPSQAEASKPLPGTTVIETAPPLDPAKAKANAAALAAQAADGAARQRIPGPSLIVDPFQPVQGKITADGIPQKSNKTVMTPPPLKLPPSTVARLDAARAAASQVDMEGGVPMLHPPSSERPVGVAPEARPNTQVLPALLPDIPLMLAGVIRGEINSKGVENGAVAMIQAGDGQQFVRIGEIIEGWRVLRIGGETVTLRRANRIRVLRIGAGPASQGSMPYLTPIRAAAPTTVGTPYTPATPAPAATPAALTASPMPTATPGADSLPLELTTLTSSR